ncbi:tRNA (N(6)-L-threonylcarbamoyladenosine(37)-C(2))-methylthiotransferase [Candidatus Woesearchaeota archaeon]|nr:tRNA (N(6)-L-threonylcarbamoyladenosine(37)-C(2))-methylthiotransferase [Candidatus Woesearchaeota archaeon]
MTSIFIKTFGCSHNVADSEELAYYLSNFGYTILGLENVTSHLSSSQSEYELELLKQADLIIYNTCTVKNPSDDKFFTLLKRTNKPVVLAGCIPQSQVADEWLKDYSAIGVDNLDLIVEVVEGTLKGDVVHRLKKRKSLDDRELPIIRRNSFVAIIPILQGCLGSCTYCKTKQARGHLKSYPKETIIKQIRKAKHEGVKEIWLVSEDNGAYGKDIDSSLPDLLRNISYTVLNSDIMVRVGMLNPEYAFEYKIELAEIIKQDCFYKFLHIPIQCANDSVLKDMNRPYTTSQFKESFSYLREKIPDITLATDIICGFPTESPEQFLDTLNYVKEEKFTVINISKFYPRPKTPAARMKLLPTHEVKRRSKELSDWFSGVNFNEPYVGQTLSVLFTEKGNVDGSFIGKTNNYRNVIVKSKKDILGMRFNVKIHSTTRDDLRGEIVN